MTDQILDEARQICPTTANKAIVAGALLVDVRERPEIERLAFDVPGVIEMPLSELAHRFDELPRDRDLVIACQVGGRSLKATYFLMYQGFDRVANLDGGIVRWAAREFPLQGDPGSLRQAGQTAASCCGDAAAPAGTGCCDSTAESACGDHALVSSVRHLAP